MKKYFFTSLLGVLLSYGAFAQKRNIFSRYVNSLLNDTTSIEKPQFMAYPTVAYSPETNWEFGASSLFVYYANRDTLNRLSEVNAFTFFTLAKQ